MPSSTPSPPPKITTLTQQIENNDNVNNNNRLSWPQFRNVNQTQPQPQQQQQHMTNVSNKTKGYALKFRDEQHNYNYKFKRDTHTPLERVLPKDEANVMERANQIVMYVNQFSEKKETENLWLMKVTFSTIIYSLFFFLLGTMVLKK